MKKYGFLIAALLAALLSMSALLASCQTQENPPPKDLSQEDPYDFLDAVLEKAGEPNNPLDSFFVAEPNEMILEMSGSGLPINIGQLTISSRQEGSLLLQTISSNFRNFKAEFWSTPETLILRSTVLDQVYGKPQTENSSVFENFPGNLGSLSALTNPDLPGELQNELQVWGNEMKEIFKQHALASLKQKEDLISVQFVLSGEDCQTLLNELLDSLRENDALLKLLIPFVSLSSDQPAASIEDIRRALDELSLKELAAKLVDSEASLKVTISATKEKIFRGIDIELTAADEGEEPETMTFTFRVGEPGNFHLLLKIPDEPSFRLSHTVKEEEDTFTGVFDLTADGTSFSPVTWTYYKKSNNFIVHFAKPGSTSGRITGTLTLSDNELVLLVEQIWVGTCDLSGNISNLKRINASFRVTYKKNSDSIPEPPVYQDLLQLNTRERKEIIRELKTSYSYGDLTALLIPFFSTT